MAAKTIVQWQNSYSVGINLVDQQHMELINETNKLFNSCLAGQEKSRLTFLDTVHEVIDYVGYHFGTEEKLMDRVNYPDSQRHKKEHKDFVREVLSKTEEFNAGRINTPLTFVYFLRDWVLHHIAVSDRKMGDFFMQMKRSGELQKITVKVKKDEASGRMSFT
ncbi:MAG: bacteriohemerythrin [Treponema sp.]|nr:bacteriohemerythrin [Treponema sp.]